MGMDFTGWVSGGRNTELDQAEFIDKGPQSGDSWKLSEVKKVSKARW